MVCKIIHLGINHHLLAEYHWKKRGEYWNITKIKAANSSENIAERSEAEFILEHYFGYNMLNATTTIEYAVEHPRWQIFPVIDFSLQAGIAKFIWNCFCPIYSGRFAAVRFLRKRFAGDCAQACKNKICSVINVATVLNEVRSTG